MWVRLTFLRMDPASLAEARTLYNSEEVSGAIRAREGYRFHYLLESVDNAGHSVSLTAWNTRANGEAYEQSGTYAKLVEKFNKWFAGPPELMSYEIHE